VNEMARKSTEEWGLKPTCIICGKKLKNNKNHMCVKCRKIHE